MTIYHTSIQHTKKHHLLLIVNQRKKKKKKTATDWCQHKTQNDLSVSLLDTHTNTL